jgi:hypothetical protein
MRCVVVNGAKLKANATCAHCGSKIGNGYIRELDTRLIYCDYRCYSIALEASVVAVTAYRPPAISAGTRSS